MALNNKTSIRIPSQLPEFIRDDVNYETFQTFIEAYYEWLELSNTANANTSIASTSGQGVTYASKNLLNYSDVDNTLDGFINYYVNVFLPNFPEEFLSDKNKVIKIARQLYQSKGTPASYKLLFRLLYNSDAELLYTRDLVFRPSDGEWYIPKYLKVQTPFTDWLSQDVKNLRVFGTKSKTIAVIENSVETVKAQRYNVYVSQIERLFEAGENVVVTDDANQPVYFKDGLRVSANTPGAYTINGKVIGSISSIAIDPKNRGLTYRVGDPVVVYGGLNSPTGVGAKAFVEETTRGSIQRLGVNNGGFGYRVDPNSRIDFINGGGGSGAIAVVQTIGATNLANVTFLGTDIIALRSHLRINANNYNFSANASANVNASLANTLTFETFETGPVDSVIVRNGGGGYTTVPSIIVESLYYDDLPSETVWIKDGVIYTTNISGSTPISSNTHTLGSLGILAPIQIKDAGQGYQANDKIIFTGGTGIGANAKVTEVTITGGISKIEYQQDTANNYVTPLGGMGYNHASLPGVVVLSANVQASGANVYVPGILGHGASLSATTDRIGAITKIGVTDFGEDYVGTPEISFRIQDLYVTNFQGDIGSIVPGMVLYQGVVDSFEYSSFIDSIEPVKITANTLTDVYRVRVYNYNGLIDFNTIIEVNTELDATYPSMFLTTEFDGNIEDPFAIRNGVKSYGSGTAKGFAKYLSGLILGTGRYLNTVGQPSSYSVLQSDIHNSYTYVLSVERPISEYRNLLYALLHPAGMRIVGRAILKNSKNFDFHKHTGLGIIYPLQSYLGWPVGDPQATIKLQTTGQLTNSGIKIVSSGNGYNQSTTTVVISPPDLPGGVQATAVANVSGGILRSVTLTNAGSGYTRPQISLSDPTTRAGNANAAITAFPLTYANTVEVTTSLGSTALNYLSNTDFIIIENDSGPVITSRIKSLDGANNKIVLDDEVFLTYTNVALCYSNTTINKIQVSELSRANTPNYDIVNGKNYANSNNHIEDIVFVGDYITVGANTYVVKGIDYVTNQITIVNEQGLLADEETGAYITTPDSNANTILIGEFIAWTGGTEDEPVPFTINRTISTPKVKIRKAE